MIDWYTALLHECYGGAFDRMVKRDLALAAATGTAKTPSAAECEASQSGGDSRNAPEQPR